MDKASIRSHVDRLWEESAVPELVEYIRIPNKSVAFDRDWQALGHMIVRWRALRIGRAGNRSRV